MKNKKSLCGGFSFFILIALLIITITTVSHAQEADKVYFNGNIYTVDKKFSKASAVLPGKRVLPSYT